MPLSSRLLSITDTEIGGLKDGLGGVIGMADGDGITNSGDWN